MSDQAPVTVTASTPTVPASSGLTAADVEGIVQRATAGLAAQLAQRPAVLPPAAAPAIDPRLAALCEAYGVEDPDELLALAPQFKDKVIKARERVADPEKRSMQLELQRIRAEQDRQKGERETERRQTALDRAMTDAMALATKHHARNPAHVIAAARADGRLAVGDDGTLYVAKGDGHTPSGEALETFIGEYLTANQHLASAPAAGSPRMPGSSAAAPSPPSGAKTFDLTKPDECRQWWQASLAGGLRTEVDDLLARHGNRQPQQ